MWGLVVRQPLRSADVRGMQALLPAPLERHPAAATAAAAATTNHFLSLVAQLVLVQFAVS